MTELIPTKMTAMVLTGHGGYEKLELHHDWSVPMPKAGEVLVKVAATGANNTDINTRIGWYSDDVQGETNAGGSEGFDQVDDESVGGWGNSGIQFPRIQGADVVGKVVRLGDGVSADYLHKRILTDNWLRGDWNNPMDRYQAGYFGSESDGGFAQYVAVPITNVGIINSDWSDEELATISCSYCTAEGMLERSRVTADDVVLITGASGGVGSALIQLVKRRGATAIALTSEKKAERVKAIGPDAIIRRGIDDWKTVIKETTGKEDVTVTADVVGGPVFADLMSVLGRGGRYVTSGAIGGKKVEVDISHLYLFDWELIGSTVNERHVFPSIIRYVENNEIRPLLHKSYPLKDLKQAQEDFLKKEHVGKLVIVPPQ